MANTYVTLVALPVGVDSSRHVVMVMSLGNPGSNPRRALSGTVAFVAYRLGTGAVQIVTPAILVSSSYQATSIRVESDGGTNALVQLRQTGSRNGVPLTYRTILDETT